MQKIPYRITTGGGRCK